MTLEKSQTCCHPPFLGRTVEQGKELREPGCGNQLSRGRNCHFEAVLMSKEEVKQRVQRVPRAGRAGEKQRVLGCVF